MTERQQLEQAIAALEQQRAVLGDVAVEAALTGLRQKLQSLDELVSPLPPATAAQRKYVTVLFADVSGYTALSETLDAEVVHDTMDALWHELDAIITTHGGKIDKHIGDAVMGLWGADAVHEGDPENAIRAALAMQAASHSLAAGHGDTLQLRIGINSGPVLLGTVGTTGEVTALGDAVNLASRLEHAAPVGEVLISHDTYRLVRGIFDVEPQQPLIIKGKHEPVRAYLVKAAKARAFRLATRGVEGIETRTIGRAAELRILQDAYRAMTAEPAKPRVITLVAEAGVGKSRLLYELENWIELLPQSTRQFKGRAVPETQNQPYSLLRDLFRLRFDIRESDPTDQVRARFEAGMGDFLEPEQIHLIGYLVGFEFSDTRAVRNLADSPSLAPLALAYLIQYFRRLTTKEPAVMLLEDLHWADDASLDAIVRLATELDSQHWLIVCAGRPDLFEHRPAWGQGLPHTRIDLQPLSPADSAALVNEILQKAETVPAELRTQVTAYSEGNPYYIEELIRMLLETGVIEQTAEHWRVVPDRLQDLRVPATLVGILQARLDRLSPTERIVLQRASVIGRFFWDAALNSLHAEGEPDADTQAGLQVAQARELVYQREMSAFAGAQEYVFNHAVLRDVVYETVLLRLRRGYHRQVAEWLEMHGGTRRSEHLGLIADHYYRAGESIKSARYLIDAGERALQTNAFRQAQLYFTQALAVTSEPGDPPLPQPMEMTVLCRLGDTFSRLGEFPDARAHLQRSLTLARWLENPAGTINALSELSWVALRQGEFAEARQMAEEALALAQSIEDPNARAIACRRLGVIHAYQGENEAAAQQFAQGLRFYEAAGNQSGIAACLNNLGIQARRQGEVTTAIEYYVRSLELARAIGDRLGVANCLNNLGVIALGRHDVSSAEESLGEALTIYREIGSHVDALSSLITIGEVMRARGDYDAAAQGYRSALAEAMARRAFPMALFALLDLAELNLLAHHDQLAGELLGLVLHHPSTEIEARQRGEMLVAQLQARVGPEAIEHMLGVGGTKDLEAVVAEVLAME